MSAEWFWNMAGTEVGPLTAEQLKAMVAAGKLTANDLVKRGRDSAWVKAGDVTLLFPTAGAWSEPSALAQQQAAPRRVARQEARQPAAGQHPSGAQSSPASSNVTPKSKQAAAAPGGKKRPPLRAVPLDDEAVSPSRPAAPVTAGPKPIPSRVTAAAGAPPTFPILAVQTDSVAVAARTSSAYAGEAVSLSEKRKRRERVMFYGSLAAIGIALVVGIIAWSLSGAGSSLPEEPGRPNIVQQPRKPLEEDLSDPAVLEKAKAVSDPDQRPAVILDQPDGDRPGAIQWIDASKGQFAARGDVKVRVREVYIGVPTLVTPAGEQHPRGNDYLWIVLEIVNDSKKQKLDYPGLRVGTSAAQLVLLTDNLGRPCPPARFRTAATYFVKGQVTTTAPVGPGESIEDVLLYKDPRGADRKDTRVKSLRLQLPGGPFGQQGTFNFEIPLSMAREMAAPSGPEPQSQEDDKPSSPSDEPQLHPSPPQSKPQPPRPKDKPGIPGVIDAL